jgi:FkbM family methyltransferase
VKELSIWRKTPIRIVAWLHRTLTVWVRRSPPRLRLLTLGVRAVRPTLRKLMYRLYPHDLRHQAPLRATILYDRTFHFPVDTRWWIEWKLYFEGYYEHHLVSLLYALLSPGDHVIDVGANIGVHTLIMSKRVGSTGKVLAIEPYPPVQAKLARVLSANGVTNVEVLPIAVADAPGTLTLSAETETYNQGVATLYPADAAESEGIPVATDTLDNVVRARALPALKLMKMDIQGGEYPALRGGKEMLARYRPFVAFEYDRASWDTAKATFEEAAEFLVGLQYALYRIEKDGRLTPLNGAPPRRADILAVPDPGQIPPHLLA